MPRPRAVNKHQFRQGYTWGQVRALNEQIYRHHKITSLKAVLEDYADYHAKMLSRTDRRTFARRVG